MGIPQTVYYKVPDTFLIGLKPIFPSRQTQKCSIYCSMFIARGTHNYDTEGAVEPIMISVGN